MATKPAKVDKLARQRRQQRDAAAESTRAAELNSLLQEIAWRVPAVLAELEAQDFPDLLELNVLDPGFFRTTRRRSVGAWLIAADKHAPSNGCYSGPIYLLSDGRFLIGGAIIYPRPETGLVQLRGIAGGLRALAARLEPTRPARRSAPQPRPSRLPLPPPTPLPSPLPAPLAPPSPPWP